MTALPPRIASRIVERDGCWLWNNRRARARAQLRALVAGHPAGRAA